MKKVRVNAYEIGLVFKNGAYKRMLKEGTYWFWKGEDVKKLIINNLIILNIIIFF